MKKIQQAQGALQMGFGPGLAEERALPTGKKNLPGVRSSRQGHEHRQWEPGTHAGGWGRRQGWGRAEGSEPWCPLGRAPQARGSSGRFCVAQERGDKLQDRRASDQAPCSPVLTVQQPRPGCLSESGRFGAAGEGAGEGHLGRHQGPDP